MKTCVSPLPFHPLYHSPSRNPLTETKDLNLSLMVHPFYQDTNDPCRTPLLQPVPRIDCLSGGISRLPLTSLLPQSRLSMNRMMYADVIAMFPPFSALSIFRSLTFAKSCPRNDHAQNQAILRMGSTP
jgi:hypothetical protein